MAEKKKVLILGKLPPPYMGPSVAFEILINSGLKENYHLLHLDVKANESLATLGKWSLKKVFTNFNIYSKLAAILKNEKPDLVLIPISQATLGFFKDSIFIIICKIYSTKVMIQLRGSDFKRWISNASSLVRFYVKQVMKIPGGVIVLGQNLKYLFEDFFPKERIFVVPNGGNYNVSERQYLQTSPVKIIYLANLQPSKGIEDVIEALRIVNHELPNSFTMEIIGEWRKPETKHKCLSIIEENKIPVTFFDSSVSKKKFDFLTKSDIFIFTPREPEGHPWVIVEAMASGLAIISTDQGAIVESVINGENGFIVKAKSPIEIADKLKLLINDSNLRAQMGKKSRQFYLEKFTETRMVQNFSNAFNSIIRS